MKSALKEGRWPFPVPLGYFSVVDSEGKPTIVPDPERAPSVRRAFELYTTGTVTKAHVLRQVTLLGLRTKTGKKVTSQTFNLMLHNALYAGWMCVKKWEIYERGSFEPLVDEGVFDQVQAVLKGKKPTIVPHKRNHPDFPLRIFVLCASCGKPLTGAWSTSRSKKKYPYYRCPTKLCKRVNIRKEACDRQFV